MKTLFTILLLSGVVNIFAQMGQIWPAETRQEFDVDANYQITKTYDQTTVCQFFMFINNNEFIHVTDNITSLYKIIKREKTADGDPMYTVVSENGNTYTYLFRENVKQVFVYSTKGYAISFGSLKPYSTKVFENINR